MFFSPPKQVLLGTIVLSLPVFLSLAAAVLPFLLLFWLEPELRKARYIALLAIVLMVAHLGSVYLWPLVVAIFSSEASIGAQGFFGGLAASLLPLSLLWLVPGKLPARASFLRAWCLSILVGFGLLKLRCFLEGCCYGIPFASKWAVTYVHSKHVPWLFMQLFPVQLAESAFLLGGGFLFVCARSRYSILREQALYVCLTYIAALRFAFDFLRFDHVLQLAVGAFSLNQALAAAIPALLIAGRVLRLHPRPALSALALLTLTGCIYPDSIFDRKDFTVHESANIRRIQNRNPTARPTRNLLYAFSDHGALSRQITPLLESHYGKGHVTLEDFTLWWNLDAFSSLYSTILHIPAEDLGESTFFAAMEELDRRGEAFDVILLTHGFGGLLASNMNSYFLSPRELAAYRRKFTHLNLVFLQACQGQYLAQSFLDVGAHSVIAFDTITTNVFWIDSFLKAYARKFNVAHAYESANATVQEDVHESFVFSQVIGRLYHGRMSALEYVNQIELPIMTDRNGKETRARLRQYIPLDQRLSERAGQ